MIKDSRRGSVKWLVLGFLTIVIIVSAAFTSLNTDALETDSVSPTQDVVDTTELTVKYLKDHGYSILTATGGGNLAGAKIQLPDSFDAVIDGFKIGELLKEKNELSKLNEYDFTKFLGQKILLLTWGLEGTADSPDGQCAFFLIHDGNIVGVWFEPSSVNGEKNMTLSIFERIQTS